MTKEELIEKTDKAISELVYPKWELLKAYNYYNGVRDPELFRYLEERFGTSVPTAITFTPLIRKHIDAILGEYLGTPIIPMVFCKDSETINNIDREKQLKISSELVKFLKSKINNSILSLIDGKATKDNLIELQLNKIVSDISETFESEYEIAASDVLLYIMQSRETDIINVLRELFLDLLVTGEAYYQVSPTLENNNILIKVSNILNTFVEENIESPYIKNSLRAVVRHWMSKNLILSTYGKQMSKEDVKTLKEKWESIYSNAYFYIESKTNNCIPANGILSNVKVTPGYPQDSHIGRGELIPVYEVLWIEVDKDFVMLRYETVRVGEEIYIIKGKNDKVIRSRSNPNFCTLSINGIRLLNRSTLPYSLVLACADQQD